MNIGEVIKLLKSQTNRRNIEGMLRFGINTKKAFGISNPYLRNLAKKIGKDHSLALELWKTEYHEARIFASFIDDPELISEKQMDSWVKDFNSWDLCDQCCGNLFDRTIFAYKKAVQWTKSNEEFIKRAGFVMMACLSVHDKQANDNKFIKFLPIIKKASTDDRNFVKKAVNWALRQIGKRNSTLNKEAIKTAKEILKLDFRSARWIAKDALRELKSEGVKKRLKF